MLEIYYVLILEKTEKMNKKLENISEGSIKADTLTSAWKVSNEVKINEGALKAVSVSEKGIVYIGGDSFISGFDGDLKQIWNLHTEYPITSLANYGDTIYATTVDLILVLSIDGKIIDEWGPFEDKSLITSVSANKSFVVFADAANKLIGILDKAGKVKKILGQNDGQFVLPSPYFDVALGSDNTLYDANTGHRRVETRGIDGDVKGYFGEPGTAPGAFCGCCNPAHFTLIPGGFVTAEKGINRIKILNKSGEFVEYVSTKNKFTPSVPLDIASVDGKTIYAANSADSKLYVFNRKHE
jgi:hypothetical protein